MTEKKKKLIFVSIIILVIILMFFLNIKTLLILDDFAYHYKFCRIPTDETKFIQNPLEIFESMAIHWKIWGGRVVTHFLLQLCFFIGDRFFDIINSFMFALFGYLIYKHVHNKKEVNIPFIIFIYTISFLLIPDPSSSVMWKSGSANYLWSTNLLLIMSLIYKKHFDDEKEIKNTTLNTILIPIYGLIVGCTNENTPCALIVLEILYTIAYKKKYKKIPKWAIITIITTLIGYIFLLSAPGNYERVTFMLKNDPLGTKVDYSINGIITRIIFLTKKLIMNLYQVIIIVITTGFFINKKKSIKEIIHDNTSEIIFLIFAIISVYSLILSPSYYTRCLFFAFTYLLIVISINIIKLLRNNKYVFNIIIISLTVITTINYGFEYYYIDKDYKSHKKQYEYIEYQSKLGNKNIEIEIIDMNVLKGRYNVFPNHLYITSDKNEWLNMWVAKYYNVDSIVGVEKKD